MGLPRGLFTERKNDWVSFYSAKIKKVNDTVFVPKLLFSTESVLHSANWKYLKCKEIAEGNEVDFYHGGIKRIEGFFLKGKPTEIKEYREDGAIEIEYFYDYPRMDYKRVSYFDDKGELKEYEVYNRRRKITILKTYNKEGELIKKEKIKI